MKELTTPLFNHDLVDMVIPALHEKKAEEIIVFNPGPASSVADWFILCQGTNEIHNKAIGENVVARLKEAAIAPSFGEGTEDGRWIIIDYIDVVVMILLPDLAQYYGFELLWQQYPSTAIPRQNYPFNDF